MQGWNKSTLVSLRFGNLTSSCIITRTVQTCRSSLSISPSSSSSSLSSPHQNHYHHAAKLFQGRTQLFFWDCQLQVVELVSKFWSPYHHHRHHPHHHHRQHHPRRHHRLHPSWGPHHHLQSLSQHFGTTHFLVFNTGVVLWVPPAKFRAFCKVKNIKHNNHNHCQYKHYNDHHLYMMGWSLGWSAAVAPWLTEL